jgi:3'-5' exoribonuclease 1
MRWKDNGDGALASRLEVVDEFRTFVRPTWRPTLTEFCIELTGISQVGSPGTAHQCLRDTYFCVHPVGSSGLCAAVP